MDQHHPQKKEEASVFQKKLYKYKLWHYILLTVIFYYPEGVTPTPASENITSPVIPTVDKHQIALAPYLEFYLDKSTEMELEDILETSPVFKKQEGNLPSFGFCQDAIWGRFSIKIPKGTKEEWYLHLDFPLIEHFDLYLLIPGKPVQKIPLGMRSTTSINRAASPDPFTLLVLPEETEVTVYFRAYTLNDAIEIPLSVKTETTLLEDTNMETLFQGFYYGIILIMFAYNFFIYLSTKDKNYILYTLYVITNGLAMSCNHGRIVHFFGENFTAYYYFMVFFTMICPIFAILFAMNFLQMKVHTPFLYRVMQGFMVLYPVYGFLTLFLDTYPAIYYFILLIIGSFTLLVAGFRLYRHYNYARLYTHAWSAYIILIIIFSLRSVNIHFFFSMYAVEIGGAIEMVLLSFALADKIKSLKKETETDQLTGLLNKKAINRTLFEIFEQSRFKNGNKLTLMVIDIDFFKNINDSFGHAAGDQVLQEIASTIAQNIRSEDLAGRWGGEEFVVILKDTTIEEGHAKADDLRKTIEKQKAYLNIKVSVSIGVACHIKGESAKDLFQRADQALYRAKNKGRNRVERCTG